MKNILGLLVLFALSTVSVTAQTKTTVQTTTTVQTKTAVQLKDEKAVAVAVDALNKAIVTPDRKFLTNIASDKLSYGHSGGKIQNKAEFVEDLITGAIHFLTVDITEQTISVAGNNAIVRHIFSSKATNAGGPFDLKIGILMVWTKENGQWKLFARQAYKLP